MKPAAEALPSEPPIRILKSGTCPSLSGKSTLTYHVGCVGDDIAFRVFANTGGGFFNQKWIPLASIQQRFDKQPEGFSITSHTLSPLFQGQSMNSPAFLLAALKAEGLVEAAKDKKRCHTACNPEGFLMATKALMATDVDLKVVEKTRKKPAKTAMAKVVPAKITDKPKATTLGKKAGDKAASNASPQTKLGL
jgi:hypothetical protein